MSIFFNGRKITTPTTVSAVVDSALADLNVATGNNLAIIGTSTSGQPGVVMAFSNPTDAEAVLGSGDLVTAIKKAFNPSNQTGGAAEVFTIRVNPAVQSTLVLDDSTTAPSINLASLDYGDATKIINVSIAAGSISGIQATVQQGEDYFTQDNITRSLLQIAYTGGQASANMTVNGATLTLFAPTGNQVQSIDLTLNATIGAVAAAINSTAGFQATVLGANDQLPAANGFDYVTAVDVKTNPYSAMGVLQSVVDWFNSGAQGLVSATRATNAGLPPAVIANAYLTGGTNGVTTTTQYQNALTVLQTQDVSWVVAASSDPAVHAMLDAHVQYMSTVGRSERIAISGTALATSDATGLNEALGLNSQYTGLCFQGHYDYDENGNLVLYPPYMTAALIAGGFAGSSPGTPMTNKSLVMRGLERNVQNPSETDILINGGLIAVEKTANGYNVVKSCSTYLTDDKFDNVELSTRAAVNYVARSVRAAVDFARGTAGTPEILSEVVSATQTTLTQLAVAPPTGPGVITGDANNPAFKGIRATLVGDNIQLTFQCSPVIPVNFITVTIYVQAFSGSIAA